MLPRLSVVSTKPEAGLGRGKASRLSDEEVELWLRVIAGDPQARSSYRRARRTASGVPRVVGFCFGLAIVALALIAWRVPPGDGMLGADVTFFSVENGNLAVSPAGPFAQKRKLEQGDELEGRVTVGNRSSKPVRIQLRAPADRPDLDSLLDVEATAGKTVLYRGRLVGLRQWTTRTFRLDPGARKDVRLHAVLPQDAGGRFATLNLELRAQ
jgi:hypothetical protein